MIEKFKINGEREMPHVSIVSRKFEPNGYLVPFGIALLILALVWMFHLQMIGIGGISEWDEFHTLDRSSSFLTTGDWFTVYGENEVSFRKPPLQYWVTALLLESGIDEVLALRLPSMAFSLGCLIAVAMLAVAILPAEPWVAPASVLLLGSSNEYWRYSLSAFLDIGMIFFTVLALAATILALRRPQWWYVAGAAVGLGSLQKAPVALIFVALYLLILSLTNSRDEFGFKALSKVRQFRISFWIAIAATLAWPTIQAIRHDPSVFEAMFKREMIERFLPDGIASDPQHFQRIYQQIFGDEPVLRGLGIIALALLPWRLRRQDLIPLPVMFAIYAIAISFVEDKTHARYTLTFVPLFACSIAAVSLSLCRKTWAALLVVASVSAANFGPLKSAKSLEVYQSDDLMAQVEVLKVLGKSIKPNETLLICNWDRDKQFSSGAISYYASDERQFYSPRSLVRLQNYLVGGSLHGALRGVCTPEQLDVLSNHLVGLSRIGEMSGYVLWTARDAKQ